MKVWFKQDPLYQDRFSDSELWCGALSPRRRFSCLRFHPALRYRGGAFSASPASRARLVAAVLRASPVTASPCTTAIASGNVPRTTACGFDRTARRILRRRFPEPRCRSSGRPDRTGAALDLTPDASAMPFRLAPAIA